MSDDAATTPEQAALAEVKGLLQVPDWSVSWSALSPTDVNALVILSTPHRQERAAVSCLHEDGGWRALTFEVLPLAFRIESWIPYSETSLLGVAFRNCPFEPGTTELAIEEKSSRVVIPLDAGRVRWDVERASARFWPDPLEVRADGAWHPTLEPGLPFRAAFVAATYGRKEKSAFWAWSLIHDQQDAPLKLKWVLALVAALEPASEHGDTLGALGAGPLEDLMSDWLLDALEAHGPPSPALRLALWCVRMDSETPALQARLERYLATVATPVC